MSADRKSPDGWESIANKLPEPFREPTIARAWAVHDEIMHKGRGVEANIARWTHVTATTTAIAEISALSFMPLHLITSEQTSDALEKLKVSVGELSSWLVKTYPTADTVLIVGDQPQIETFHEKLDDVLASQPAKRIVCGPGPGVEALVRAYTEEQNWAPAQVCSIDDRGGAGWNQTPGPRLEKMVDDLVRQHHPNRIIAFEPLQMPSSHLIMERATKDGIPVVRVEASAPRQKLRP